jgi:hypothetical protein
MREVKDWIVVNLAYKPYDMVQDWLRDPLVVEWLGLVSFTFVMVYLAMKTTKLAFYAGLESTKKN